MTRIRIGALLLLVAVLLSAYPRLAPDVSTHMCDYTQCTVRLHHAERPTTVDPDVFGAAQLAAGILFDLVRDHFGDDRLLGS